MRVLHLCLSCFYIDNRGYQENELVREHARSGHVVKVIASTLMVDMDGRQYFVEPGSYISEEGFEVIRIPYSSKLPLFLSKKLRIHDNLVELIKDFNPDRILFHGMCGWGLFNVISYKKLNPTVKVFVDTHTDFVNSARTVLSKWVLHFLFYRSIVLRCLPYIDKVLYISELTYVFAKDFYRIPQDKLEFFPLGGHLVPIEDYYYIRNKIRERLAICSDDIVIVQSGKQSSSKKILESLKAFSKTKGSHLKFLIVGTLLRDVKKEAEEIISIDNRISFLGWKSPDELKEILCGADIYLQPGSQSSTMQTSLCCFCIPILQDIQGHEFYTKKNGWLVNSQEDIEAVFCEIINGQADLHHMKLQSMELASQFLDYKILAKRILE